MSLGCRPAATVGYPVHGLSTVADGCGFVTADERPGFCRSAGFTTGSVRPLRILDRELDPLQTELWDMCIKRTRLPQCFMVCLRHQSVRKWTCFRIFPINNFSGRKSA
ncbi:hypothetical protein J6590_077000 [Homalodisca vitripennis]|nr:hypothetical protein J6590_077000 [Homalodisca vitripennis]